MKVLFICNQNKNRSKTAETLFRGKFDVKSAGLYNESPVSKRQILWADTIIVMEESQRSELARRFPKEYLKKRIVSMDIPDIYGYNQPELISIMGEKIKELL